MTLNSKESQQSVPTNISATNNIKALTTDVQQSFAQKLREGVSSLGNKMLSSIGQYQSRSVLNTLLRTSRDPSPTVRAKAIYALGRFPDDKARKRLEEAMNDPEGEVVIAATNGLL